MTINHDPDFEEPARIVFPMLRHPDDLARRFRDAFHAGKTAQRELEAPSWLALRAELAQVTEERDAAREVFSEEQKHAHELAEENLRLRAVLEPFAKAARDNTVKRTKDDLWAHLGVPSSAWVAAREVFAKQKGTNG